MGIAVQAIFDRVTDIMQDDDIERWPEEERLRWINDFPAAMLGIKPSALARRSVHALAAGTYQTLPDGGVLLLDIPRNINSDGATAGKVVRRTDRQLLDDADPDWHTGTKKSAVVHYTFDDRMPKVFYVWPPVNAGVKVELFDAALPDEVTSVDDELDVGAEYIEAAVNYVLYRCHLKDGEYANNALAMGYYQAFGASLGQKAAADNAASPNQPGNSV